MKTTALAIAKLAYVGATVALLLFSLYLFDGEPNSDAALVLTYGMLALTFPAGVVVSMLASLLAYAAFSLIGITLTTSYPSMVLLWAVLFAFGYFQWFILLPRVVRHLRATKSG